MKNTLNTFVLIQKMCHTWNDFPLTNSENKIKRNARRMLPCFIVFKADLDLSLQHWNVGEKLKRCRGGYGPKGYSVACKEKLAMASLKRLYAVNKRETTTVTPAISRALWLAPISDQVYIALLVAPRVTSPREAFFVGLSYSRHKLKFNLAKCLSFCLPTPLRQNCTMNP